MKQPSIELFVTSNCTEACEHCNQNTLMSSRRYDMSLESIERFIFFTKRSNYMFQQIVISGGESLLWSNFVEGITLLHQSDIAKSFKINTAANLNLLKKKQHDIRTVTKLTNVKIRPSKYWFNQSGIDFLFSEFPRHKIKVEECRNFMTSPQKMQDINLETSKCWGPTFSFYDDKIIWCANLLSLKHRFKLTDEDPIVKYKSVEITDNYLEKITDKNRWGKEKICSGCICCTGVSHDINSNVNTKIKNEPLTIVVQINEEFTVSTLNKCMSSMFFQRHSGLLEIIFCGEIDEVEKSNIKLVCQQNVVDCKFQNLVPNEHLSDFCEKARHRKIFFTHSFIELPSNLIETVNQRTTFDACFVPKTQNKQQNEQYIVFGCNKSSLKTTAFEQVSLSVTESNLLSILEANKIPIVRTLHEPTTVKDLKHGCYTKLTTELPERVAVVTTDGIPGIHC
jgi:organic radical activating enzyme